MSKSELKIKSFSSDEVFRRWLDRNHAKSPGIWLKIQKKSSKRKFISYDEALETLLCFGWIDSQRKSFDEESFLQKITPRQKKSPWSERNALIVKRLIKEGRMCPSGLEAVKEAKSDGRWP